MDGFLHQPLHAGEWIGLLLLVSIVGGVMISVVAILTNHYRQAQLDEMEATLKMEMLAREMSPQDITQVLHAKSGSEDPRAMADLFDAMSAGRGHSCREARRATREAIRNKAHGTA
jgi:hypothetical protein